MSRSLLLNPKFFPLFVTQFMGAINDNIFKNALVILITYKTVELWGLGAADLVALAGGVFILPFFLFSACAGQICDFFQKRKVIIATKFSEMAIVILAMFGLYLSNFKLLMFVLFLLGVQSTFFGPLKYGSLPDLVGKRYLVGANALVSAGTFVAILMGTLIGGGLASFENSFISLSMVLGLVSLIGLLSSFKVMNLPIHHEQSRDQQKVDWTFFRPTWNVLKLTWQDRDLFKSVLFVSWFWFLGAGILSVLPVLVREVYLASEGVATLFLTIFTIGMGLGAYIARKAGKDAPEKGLTPIALLFLSFSLAALTLVSQYSFENSSVSLQLIDFIGLPSSWVCLVLLLAVSTFGGSYIVPLMSDIQLKASSKELARIIAGCNIWNALFMVLASVLLILLYAQGLDVLGVLWVLVALNTLVSFVQYALDTQGPIHFLARVLVYIFYDLRVTGRDHLSAKGPYIIISNHVSFVDWLFIMAVSKRPVQFVIDHHYYYLPGFPFWLSQAKLIPIATKKEKAELLNSAFQKISTSLANGAVIGFFPEGAITRDGKMRRFMPGLSKIVAKDPVDVIPIALDGLWGSFFSRSGRGALRKWPSLRRRTVFVKIGQPIKAQDADMKRLQAEINELLAGKLESEDSSR